MVIAYIDRKKQTYKERIEKLQSIQKKKKKRRIKKPQRQQQCCGGEDELVF